MKLNNPTSKLFFFTFFMTYAGFYCVLMIMFHLGLSGASRTVTIPIRLAIDLSLVAIFLLNIRTAKLYPSTLAFMLFAFFYYFRISVHYVNGDEYYFSTIDLYLYFTSFAVMPFLLLSGIQYKERYFKAIIHAMLLTNFIFPVMTFITYQSYIGQVGRLSGLDNEAVISPLALSYTSAMGIGVITMYLIYNRTSLIIKLFGVISIGLGFIPYFLGSSRGSVFSLFIPFLFIFFDKLKIKHIIYSVTSFIVILASIYFLAEKYDSALFERFLSIQEDVEEAKMSASRVDIWTAAFNQFLANPYIGGQLAIKDMPGKHAHNAFLEVLQTTGLAGFVPFFLLILGGFWSSIKIIRADSRFFWVAVIYIQCVIMSSFSGSIVVQAWLWTSLALVYATVRYLKNVKIEERLIRNNYNYGNI